MAAAGASYRTCFAVLALLLAFAPTNQALRRLQQSSATGGRRIEQPDYNVYHKKSVLLDKVAQIVASNPATMKVRGSCCSAVHAYLV